MTKAIFHGSVGNELLITDMSALKRDVIDNFDTFWMQGSGDGYPWRISLFSNRESVRGRL